MGVSHLWSTATSGKPCCERSPEASLPLNLCNNLVFCIRETRKLSRSTFRSIRSREPLSGYIKTRGVSHSRCERVCTMKKTMAVAAAQVFLPTHAIGGVRSRMQKRRPGVSPSRFASFPATCDRSFVGSGMAARTAPGKQTNFFPFFSSLETSSGRFGGQEKPEVVRPEWRPTRSMIYQLSERYIRARENKKIYK